MGDKIMKFNNLSIGYSSTHGLIEIQKDINGSLKRGEFVCLFGPNGAGKSTLLRTISGLQPPLKGEIIINEENLTSLSSNDLARQLAIVLTERPSVSSMQVKQLIGLGRSPYTGFWGRLMDKDNNVIKRAMELTDTAYLAERYVDSLSDGECQRVMIARALAQETPVIMLDEPTAFLDFPGKAHMMILLRKLAHSENKAILLSTHDLNMAIPFADKLWLVDKNNGIVMGSPEELAQNGCLQQYFSGEGIKFDMDRMEFIIEDSEINNC